MSRMAESLKDLQSLCFEEFKSQGSSMKLSGYPGEKVVTQEQMDWTSR